MYCCLIRLFNKFIQSVNSSVVNFRIRNNQCHNRTVHCSGHASSFLLSFSVLSKSLNLQNLLCASKMHSQVELKLKEGEEEAISQWEAYTMLSSFIEENGKIDQSIDGILQIQLDECMNFLAENNENNELESISEE